MSECMTTSPCNAAEQGTVLQSGSREQVQRHTAVAIRQEDLRDADFRREELLGQGSYSIVSLATHLPSRTLVALKQISRHRLHSLGLEEQLQWEINVHRTLRHPNVVRLYSYYITARYITLVLEYCPGGTLMQRVRRAPGGFLDEHAAAWYARHIARALLYLHEHSIAHRDLKLENVLLDRHGVAKLADFGWSKKVPRGGGPERGGADSPSGARTVIADEEKGVAGCAMPGRASDEVRRTVCGTLDYLSPEMVSGEAYCAQTDVWSLGVLITEMVTGLPPFYRPTHQDTLRAIRDEEPDLDGLRRRRDTVVAGLGSRSSYSRPRECETTRSCTAKSSAHAKLACDGIHPTASSPSIDSPLSLTGRDLVLSLLRKDPAKRPSIAQVLRHPWLQKRKREM